MNKTMNQLVAEFPAQMEEAIGIASKFSIGQKPDFENVLICGLGGSGIGGTILSQLIVDECAKPVLISKDYTIPKFVDERTMVIACSYSGNTEETLGALNVATDQNAQVVCLTSGGKLLELAKENNWPHMIMPGGYPPRSAFGFSSVLLFKMASELGLIDTAWLQAFETSKQYISDNQDEMATQAESLAQQLHHKIPVIYSAQWLEGVGTRWQQQINENAKALCWNNYYPEMNHNELVGWRDKNDQLSVVMLKSNFDHARVSKRMELSETVYAKYASDIHTVQAIGDSKIEQALYLIHFGDWMSVHLADAREMDSTEVHVIDWLKGELAKF